MVWPDRLFFNFVLGCQYVIFWATLSSSNDLYGQESSIIGEDPWGGLQMRRHKCIDIPSNLTACQGVGYNQMRLPNLFGHDSLLEVYQQTAIWIPLIGRKCHPDTKLFLCSLFTPVCLDQAIYPCQSLCTVVKRSCEEVMIQWGYPWPDMLSCDRFPVHDVCMHPQHTTAEDNVCPPCKEPDTFEGLVDSFCRADAVFRVTVDSTESEGGYLKINFLKKKRAYKREKFSKRETRKLIGYIENGDQCECVKNNATMLGPKSRLLVMGKRQKDRFVLFFISPYQRKLDSFRKATKMWKKDGMCKTVAIPEVYIEKPPEEGTIVGGGAGGVGGSVGVGGGMGVEEKPETETEEKSKKKSRKGKGKKKKKKKKKGSKRNKDGAGGRGKKRRKNRKPKEPPTN